MHGHAGHPLALRREPSVRIKRAEQPQQRRRLVPRARGRRCHPGEAVPLRRAPGGAGKDERGEVRVEYLGRRLRRTLRVRAFVPEPVARPLADAPCATAALLGAVLRQRQRDESAHPGPGRKARHAHETGVDHARYAGDREGGFRYGRRKDDLPPRSLLEDPVLLLLREASVERQHVNAAESQRGHRVRGAPDLAFAGEKAQDVSVRLPDGARNGGGHGNVAEVLGIHGEHAPFGADDLGVFQMRRDLVRVKRGGHDEKPHVGPERPSHVQRKREGKVARKRALVEFVEDDEPRVRELRVPKEALREKPLGHDLQTRGGRHLALEAHLVAHRAADGLAQPLRDVRSAAARREPARLEHDDLPAAEPRLVEKRRRHARRLAAARRGGQDHASVRRKRAAYLRDFLFDGEGHG